ncbi:hypothetical protein [Marinobacter sp.]|uniref:hypothetical protein n=1 Tax=Marinobacter sp. TaxID=50741 RepID=UPI003564F26C
MSTNTRPILLNCEMVRAILEGRKTQTRRVATNVYYDSQYRAKWKAVCKHTEVSIDTPGAMLGDVCPYGQPGDRLWVRETWADASYDDGLCICYRADKERKDVTSNFAATFGRLKYANWAPDLESGAEGRWKPSIHMPRWASRITLEITNVRVERLQDISEADAKAEGVIGEKEAAGAGLAWYDKPRRAFQFLWQSINGPDSWEANPWVWVIEFKRIPQEATS